MCLSTSLEIRNCCRDLGDPTMATGKTKDRPYKVVGMFLRRGLDALRGSDILQLGLGGFDPCHGSKYRPIPS